MHQPSQQTGIFEASLAPEAPWLILDLRGELDLFSAKQVPMEPYTGRRDLTTVVVNIAEVTFCDVAGLSALLTLCRMHESQGRTVSIVGAGRGVQRLMRLCGVWDRLEAAQAVSPALASPA